MTTAFMCPRMPLRYLLETKQSLMSLAKKKNRLNQELKFEDFTKSKSNSLLHQLHDALCVHEEHFPL